MDMYKLKFTRLQNEIFRLCCINVGNPLNQRGIAKLLKVSPTAVSKAIVLLEKEKLINTRRDNLMNLCFTELNRDNSMAIHFKRVENLKMVYQSGLIDSLEDKFPGSTIILFGSFSKGEDTIKSDIDLAIIGSKSKNVNLDKYNELLEREVRVNSYVDWKEINKNLRDNILNGIVLIGGIEL